MDGISLRRKTVFFNNLVLLGLNPVTLEQKHGIAFHKNMFNLPNKKGYEVVTCFLFSKLSAATGKDYSLPWPIYNREVDRIFQKTCYTHLVSFSQRDFQRCLILKPRNSRAGKFRREDENEVRFPRIVPSSLATFGGDRFYEVYLAFSCYVINKTIRKNRNINYLSRPNVSQENFNAVKEVVQLSTILNKEKFREIEIISCRNDLIWRQFAKNLSECLQKLKQLKKTNMELLKRNKMLLYNLYSVVPDDFKAENLTEKCLISLKLASKQRKILQQFFSTEEKLWGYLASEVGENVDIAVLYGQDCNISVTENLPEKFSVELGKVGFSTSEEDGKMSVLRYLMLLLAYLKPLTELITNRSDLPETNVKNASVLEYDLNSINNINKKLSEEIIPNLEDSIKKLKLSHCFEEVEKSLEVTSSFCQISSLPALSFKPEEVKERALCTDGDLEEMLKFHSSEISGSDTSRARSIFSTNLSILNTSILELANCNDSDYGTSLCSTDAVDRTTASANLFEQNLESERLNFPETLHSSKSIVSLESSTSYDLNISTLDDREFASSGDFKMRKSWLQEECLSSMTLPNLSFDD